MLPFDKRYIPDMMFRYNEPIISRFPDEVGKGSILLKGALVNLATECWIIDDDCIQFDARTPYMYAYNLYTKDYRSYDMNKLDQSDMDWLVTCCSNSKLFQENLKKIEENPKNKYEESTYLVYRNLFSVLYFSNSLILDKSAQIQLAESVNFLNNSFDTTFIKGHFYTNNDRLKWSSLCSEIRRFILDY